MHERHRGLGRGGSRVRNRDGRTSGDGRRRSRAARASDRLTLLSAGAAFKGRIPIGESFVLRVGLLAGSNLLWASGNDGKGNSYSAHGYGFDLGMTVEGALRLSKQWGLSGQVAFPSELAGSITIDGDSKTHDLQFAPLFFLAVGPEIYL